MKKHIQLLLREHFSFSAKEKRGMLVLASILFCLLGFRLAIPYLYPNSPIQLSQDEWAEGIRLIETADHAEHPARPQKSYGGFYFDPNTVSEDSLIDLGLSPKQASAWINYRNAGAEFRKAENLQKLFFMGEDMFEQLEPWIQITTTFESRKTEVEQAPRSTYPENKILLLLNSCDSVQLISIRGIGAYTASKVLRYRDWLGGFVDTSQFREIRGLREAQIETLKEWTHLEPSTIKRIAINTATQEELERHPYIRYKAKVIIRYREEHGAFLKAEDLIKTGVIDEEIALKLAAYLTF